MIWIFVTWRQTISTFKERIKAMRMFLFCLSLASFTSKKWFLTSWSNRSRFPSFLTQHTLLLPSSRLKFTEHSNLLSSISNFTKQVFCFFLMISQTFISFLAFIFWRRVVISRSKPSVGNPKKLLRSIKSLFDQPSVEETPFGSSQRPPLP